MTDAHRRLPEAGGSERDHFAVLDAFRVRLTEQLRHVTTAEDIPALIEPAFLEMWLTFAVMPVGEADRALMIADVAAVVGYCAALRAAMMPGLRAIFDVLSLGPT